MNGLSLLSVLTIALIAATGTGCSQATRAKSLSAYGIVPEGIERVEILYLPERILTRAALTPEMLERQYKYKVEIRDFAASIQRQQLITTVRETSVSPSNRSFDLRTAVLLYDNNGKRLLSLYFAKSGRNGVVNRESVSTSDDVYRWAKSMMRGFADQ